MKKLLQQINQGYTDKRAGLPYTRYVSRNFARPFTILFYKLNVSPNFVTLLSLLSALSGVGALFLPVDKWTAGFLMLLLLQVSYALDSSDGQLARLSGKATQHGAWFDLLVDRVTGFLVIAALLYWYWQEELFLGFGQFYLVMVVTMLANFIFSYAATLKSLVLKDTPQVVKPSLFKDLVFMPSDTGIFYLVLSLTVFITNYLPLLVYSVYKLVLLVMSVSLALLSAKSQQTSYADATKATELTR